MTVAAQRTAGTDAPERAGRDRPLRRFLALAALSILAFAGAAAALRLPLLAAAIAGTALAATLGLAIVGFRRRHPHDRVGAANVVTLARLTAVAVLLGILLSGGGEPAVVIAVSVVTLSLDGVDGYLARRQRLASDFGAAFDMEVDSGFALVLAALAGLGPAGPAALLLGIPRYLFGAAALALPWLNGPTRPRFSRKVVCVVQLIALIALQLPMLPVPLALGIVVVVAGLVAWSFGRDVIELHRARGPRAR